MGLARMNINIIKDKYKNTDDYPVTILSIDARGGCPIRGIVHTETHDNMDGWNSLDELVKIPSLEDLVIDQKVLVRDRDNQEWVCRHFAGIAHNGFILTFRNGTTSWTTRQKRTTSWLQWKLPE